MSATNLLDRLKAAPNEWRTANAINVELAPDLRSAEIRAALASLVRTGQVITQGAEDKREYAMRGLARTRITPPAPQVEAVCEEPAPAQPPAPEPVQAQPTEMQRIAAELDAVPPAPGPADVPESEFGNSPSLGALDEWYRARHASDLAEVSHAVTPKGSPARKAAAGKAEKALRDLEQVAEQLPVESIAEAVRRVLRESGRPMTSVEIRSATGLPWARVSTSLSDQTKSGHIVRSTLEDGVYRYALPAPSSAASTTPSAAELAAEPRAKQPPRALRTTLITSAQHADAALDALVSEIANPVLTAVVATFRSTYRACAQAGVTP